MREFIKVARHSEGIWLEVIEHLPNGAVKARVDNYPRCWPQKFGDVLWIKENEIADRVIA